MLRADPLDPFRDCPEMKYYVGDQPYGFDHVFGRSDQDAYVCLNSSNSMAAARPNRSLVNLLARTGNSSDYRAKCLAFDDDGRAWIGGAFGLVRTSGHYEEKVSNRGVPRLAGLVDLRTGHGLLQTALDDGGLRLTYRQNSIRVDVSYQRFLLSDTTAYKIRLSGLDASWSDWSRSNTREFTNLDAGNYTVEVIAVDSLGVESELLELPLIVERPWYFRIEAYIAYALAAILLVFCIVKANTVRLRRRNRDLEQLVAERTTEIECKNAELTDKNELLAHRRDELAETTDSLAATLEDLRAAQERLFESARAAGKAEIASNVLHTVGNGFNSVYVSLVTVSEKVDLLKIDKVGQVASLLLKQGENLPRFLSEDPKGQLFPVYLEQLSNVMRDEQGYLRSELDLMKEGLDSIKKVIEAQKVHAGNVTVVQRINLMELCDTALTVTLVGRESIKPEVDMAIDPSIEFESDRHRVLDIVVNLLSNAFDAVDGKVGYVRLAATYSADSKTANLEIRDDGCGFGPDMGPNLFKYGFTTKDGGNGWGLHSSANAASALGGSLQIESDGYGLGAVARLELPLTASSLKRERAGE